jgi:hypothetical protein
MSGNEWRLDDLFAKFPDVCRGTNRVLRCQWRVSGEGRAIKDKAGVRREATVSLAALPSDDFLLVLKHSWASELADADKQAAEAALLRGIFEGTVGCEDPPWQCRLECTELKLVPGVEALPVLQMAARAAVQSLIQGGGWEAVGFPGNHVA